jgi:hypothetical protein
MLLYSSASLIFAVSPAGFSTWRPLAGRLLWFRRACPSTTLDKKVIYLIFMKNTGENDFCQWKFTELCPIPDNRILTIMDLIPA